MKRSVRVLLGSGSLAALCCLTGWQTSASGADQPVVRSEESVRPRNVAFRAARPAPQEHAFFTQRRVAEFIAQVRGYQDFDALAKGLGDPVQTDLDIVQAAKTIPSEPPGPGMEILSVLADRRVARMYQLLSAMPADEAARRVSNCFHGRLAELESMWADCIRFAKESDDEKIARTYDRGRYHAVCCSLFLCSQFCDPGVVIAQADAWRESMETLHERMVEEQVNRFRTAFRLKSGMPQPLFVLNVYLCALQQSRPMTDVEIQTIFSSHEASLLKTKPLVKWDFPDYGHAANDENVLKRLAIVENWTLTQGNQKTLMLDRVTRELASRSIVAQ